MTESKRNPKIDEWLDEISTGERAAALKSTNQLTALQVSSELGVAEFPDEILLAWGLEIVRTRRVVNQSESAFITVARNRGWSWNRICDRLGLPSVEATEERQDALAVELDRTQPSNIPDAYKR
ncbi:hypothetical protein AB0K15_44630 [Amycolatopsis sp. NPDC049253]|uniref:hypothetical protein n=1 Tax=Amycolatopsis sp. NPDC049253 TaxID=3155274 RepID=UPI00343C852E